METVEATYKVVTPMFISGANQSKAELRLPSIKGALRFWWRALAWERHGNNLVALREAEATLFGGVSKGEGQAKILFKLINQVVKTAEQNKWRPYQWEAYVGYGLIETTGGTSRAFIEPGGTFTIQLVSREQLSEDERKYLQNTLLAFGLLGGLGGRSRKGWGSVNLLKLSGELSWSTPRNRDELEHEINRLLNDREGKPKYTTLSHATEVEFGPIQRNATAAHRLLAEAYKDTVREGYNKLEREQFGLPRKNSQQRRAGPVFLHIHELPDARAIPVAAFLPAQFLTDRLEPAGGDQKIRSFLNKVSGGSR